jgi:hypothetical protein
VAIVTAIKPRQLNTRVGKLFLSVPQDRDGSFSSFSPEANFIFSKKSLIGWLIANTLYFLVTALFHTLLNQSNIYISIGFELIIC